MSRLARCRERSHLALVHLLQELGPRLLSLLELVLHLLLLLQLHHLLVVVVLLPVLYTVHNLGIKKGSSTQSTNNIPKKDLVEKIVLDFDVQLASSVRLDQDRLPSCLCCSVLRPCNNMFIIENLFADDQIGPARLFIAGSWEIYNFDITIVRN